MSLVELTEIVARPAETAAGDWSKSSCSGDAPPHRGAPDTSPPGGDLRQPS